MSQKPSRKKPARSSTETKLIRELAQILDDENLSEIEMEKGGLRLRVTRQMGAMSMAAQPMQSVLSAPAAPQTPAPAPIDTPPAEILDAVTSPMVGTVYVRSNPDTAPFVALGDTVKEGDTLLLIEAMKTFNPITAPRSGTISKILVEDAQSVEFGENLLIIS